MTVWSLVSLGTVSTVASGNCTPGAPAGAAQGDLLVCCIAYRSTAAFTAPTGGEWTILQQQSTGNTGTNPSSSIGSGLIAFCIRGAANPNFTFTRTAGDVAMGQVVCFRSSLGGVQLVASSSQTMAANATLTSTTGFSINRDNTLLVAAFAGASDTTVTAFESTLGPQQASGATNAATGNITTLDTWVEIADALTTTGADTTLAIARMVRTFASGITGNVQTTAAASSRHVMLLAAFQGPAPRRVLLIT